jgi:hypothetical protein
MTDRELFLKIIEIIKKYWTNNPYCFENQQLIASEIMLLLEKRDEKSDIINCICLFDDTATIEEKGRYFEVIQRDLRKLINS